MLNICIQFINACGMNTMNAFISHTRHPLLFTRPCCKILYFLKVKYLWYFEFLFKIWNFSFFRSFCCLAELFYFISGICDLFKSKTFSDLNHINHDRVGLLKKLFSLSFSENFLAIFLFCFVLYCKKCYVRQSVSHVIWEFKRMFFGYVEPMQCICTIFITS